MKRNLDDLPESWTAEMRGTVPRVAERVPVAPFFWWALGLFGLGVGLLIWVSWLLGLVLMVVALPLGGRRWICGGCGNRIVGTALLCPHCGARLRGRV